MQLKPNRFRIPDITVIAGAPPSGPIITEPPFLCVEILSPRDRMTEMQERIGDYLMFGVKYVWVINPTNRRSFIYTADRMHEAEDGVLRMEKPDISVSLFDLE